MAACCDFEDEAITKLLLDISTIATYMCIANAVITSLIKLKDNFKTYKQTFTGKSTLVLLGSFVIAQISLAINSFLEPFAEIFNYFNGRTITSCIIQGKTCVDILGSFVKSKKNK